MVNQESNESKDIFIHINETNVKSINMAINEFYPVNKNSNLFTEYSNYIASFNYTVALKNLDIFSCVSFQFWVFWENFIHQRIKKNEISKICL